MAQRVSVLLVDDLDGEPADETVTFGLDGVTYEIDLTSGNAAKLRDDLASWIGHARRSGGRRTAGRIATRTSGGKRRNLSAIRVWARESGYTVSDRGRISSEVQAAYDKAHG
jgi:hypothetical protein